MSLTCFNYEVCFLLDIEVLQLSTSSTSWANYNIYLLYCERLFENKIPNNAFKNIFYKHLSHNMSHLDPEWSTHDNRRVRLSETLFLKVHPRTRKAYGILVCLKNGLLPNP